MPKFNCLCDLDGNGPDSECPICGGEYMDHPVAAEWQLTRILGNIADLPENGKLTLANIADDGLGGVIVKRHGKSQTFVFQREHSINRSRWADCLADCIPEIQAYLTTGKLHEPDKTQWF